MVPVLRAALRAGWASQMTPACVEIPWYQKRLDLGIVSQDGLVVVELKVADWRRAIKQAFVNRWVARASWVALWHESITCATYDLAQETGVGILVVTPGTAYPWVEPQPQVRSGDGSAIREEIFSRGTRVRDLLSEAVGVHRAAFA